MLLSRQSDPYMGSFAPSASIFMVSQTYDMLLIEPDTGTQAHPEIRFEEQ